MTVFRVALASLLFLALSSISNAATMSPSFEKSLGERLVTRKATLDAYPKLKYSTYLPETVEIWRVLPQTQLSDTISVFKDSIEISIPEVLKKDPANAATINQFTQDCKDFVVFYEAGVRSGDVSDATTAPPPPTTRLVTTWPTTRAPAPSTTTTTTTRPTTSPPSTEAATEYSESSGSEADEEDNGTVEDPYTYTPYTWAPSPTFSPYWSYSTPSPYIYYYDYHTTRGFSAWKIGLIVASILIFVIRLIYWASQREAKQQQKQEEEAAAAAALQVEQGGIGHATYVMIPPADHDNHPVTTKV